MTEIDQLADDLLEVQFDADPLWPALLGVDQSRPGLGDMSSDDEQHTADAMAAVLARATAVDPNVLGVQQRITRDVIIELAQSHLAVHRVRMAEFTVSDLFVAPASAVLTSLPLLSISDGEQAQAYLDRLADIPRFLDAALDRHRAGVASGNVAVTHLVQAAVAHLDRHLDDPQADPLLRPMPPDAIVDDFVRERDRLLAERVRPAFAAYRDGLTGDVLAAARPQERVGMCWLPDGDAGYAAAARAHTTADRTPQDLHDTGLALIDGLAGEYARLGQRVFGTRDVDAVFERLRTDPQLRWRDADELLSSARAAICRADDAAPAWFGTIPPQPWVVEPVPAAAAPGAPAAYYIEPAADGSRPGTYFANTYQATERVRHASEVTAFHEAIPGHHFQLSLALRLTDVPLLRRVSGFNAYIEGWGLYSERLADEMGLYSDDVARLGMLSMDSMRAGRLVVDTGLHALGWSRQQAIDFLQANTPMPLVEITAEVDRYIAYPGQALSYMVGRMEIQRLRRQAEQALGADFDIAEFHDLVLGNGSIPLAVLDSVVTGAVARHDQVSDGSATGR